MSEIFFSIAQNVKWTDSENSKQGFALDVIFQNETLFNFCLKKNVLLFSVKREMPILFFVNCGRTVLFSVKRDLDPPPPPLPPSFLCPLRLNKM